MKVLRDLENKKKEAETLDMVVDEDAKQASIKKLKAGAVHRGGKYPAAQTALEINGAKNSLRAGGLCIVKGQQGSRKSAFVAAIVAAWIGGDALGIKCGASNRNVLWLDTEQGQSTMEESLNRACNMAKTNGHPAGVDCIDISVYDDNERFGLLDTAVSIKKEGGYGLIVLDGGADFVPDINDQVKCKAFIHYLHVLGQQTGACIVLVIHENIGIGKEGGKASGWLGTIAEKKAQLIISVNIDSDNRAISIATFTKHRFSMPPQPVRFWMSGEGREANLLLESEHTPPVLHSMEMKKKQSDIDKSLNKIAVQLSINAGKIPQTKAIQTIQTAANCKESTAKKILKDLVQNGSLCRSKGVGNSNVISLP